jgi:hypothetical protein
LQLFEFFAVASVLPHGAPLPLLLEPEAAGAALLGLLFPLLEPEAAGEAAGEGPDPEALTRRRARQTGRQTYASMIMMDPQ